MPKGAGGCMRVALLPDVVSDPHYGRSAPLSPSLLRQVRSFEAALLSWTETLDALLDDGPAEPQVAAQSNAGPGSEVPFSDPNQRPALKHENTGAPRSRH